jgi:hypothetical protein
VTPKNAARRHTVAALDAERRGKGRIKSSHDAWRLPSGKRLVEFALASGFLTPRLMEDQRERDRGGKKLA